MFDCGFWAATDAEPPQRTRRTQRASPVLKAVLSIGVSGVLPGDSATELPLDVLDDLFRRQRARTPVGAGARMRARSAEKQILDRRLVTRPAEERPRDEQLIQRELAVKDMTAGQPVGPLEIERRDRLPSQHGRFESGRVALDRPR